MEVAKSRKDVMLEKTELMKEGMVSELYEMFLDLGALSPAPESEKLSVFFCRITYFNVL